MWGYPLRFLTTAFTSVFSLPWQLHEAVLYIAHFAIRNNNNLFFRFSKIKAGGGPETKHFIGVALATRKKNRTPVLTGPLSSSPVVAWRCHSADAYTRRLCTGDMSKRGKWLRTVRKNSSEYFFGQLSIHPSGRLVSQASSAKGVA